MPCIDVKDKSGKVVATVCLRHDSPEVQRMSPAERQALAESLATELTDYREQQRKILEFPQPPGKTESGGEK